MCRFLLQVSVHMYRSFGHIPSWVRVGPFYRSLFICIFLLYWSLFTGIHFFYRVSKCISLLSAVVPRCVSCQKSKDVFKKTFSHILMLCLDGLLVLKAHASVVQTIQVYYVLCSKILWHKLIVCFIFLLIGS